MSRLNRPAARLAARRLRRRRRVDRHRPRPRPAAGAPAAAADVGALAVEDRVAGTGAEARPGMLVSVHYTGWLYDPSAADKRGKKFDSSKDRGQPFEFPLGAGRGHPRLGRGRGRHEGRRHARADHPAGDGLRRARRRRRHPAQRRAGLRSRAARREVGRRRRSMTPRCAHFGACGGCQWQDVAYSAQLARKRAQLEALLPRAVPRGLPAVSPVVPMPVGDDGMPWEFRHKAAFVFGERAARPGDGPLRRRRPRRSCRSSSARCTARAPTASPSGCATTLARARVRAAGPRLDGVLRHVIVRTSADERDAVALLVVTRNDPSLRKPVRALLASADRPDGFFLNIHDRPSPYMVGRTTIRIDGPRARPRAARSVRRSWCRRPRSSRPTRWPPRRWSTSGAGAGRRRAAAGARPLCRQRPVQPAAGAARARGDRGRGEPSGGARRRRATSTVNRLAARRGAADRRPASRTRCRA